MNNNDVLRKMRYIFDYSDEKMISIFALGEVEADRAQVSAWLKKDDDPEFQGIYDKPLAGFLNGFIILKRGRRDGPAPKAEKTLNNNLILRKIKIALALRDDHILELMELAELPISKHELSALFRKPGQKQYRLCKDQFLRNFLMGLQLKFRDGY